MKTATLVLLLLFLYTCVSCAPKAQDKDPQIYEPGSPTLSAPWITKTNTIWTWMTSIEVAPINWNGQMLFVICDRGNGGMIGTAVNVSTPDGVSVGSAGPADLSFCSTLLENGTLYVFGTSGNGSGIKMTSTTDLLTWTVPVQIFTADAGDQIFNTSITKDDTGYVIAYENCISGEICYHFNFLRSVDVVHWDKVAGQVGGLPGGPNYEACPTIRYFNGYYYAAYVPNWNHLFATKVARSRDLVTWEVSAQTMLSPFDEINPAAANTSDMDMVEINGQVNIVYYNGPQYGGTYSNTGVRLATYNGTTQSLLERFFQ